MVRASLLTEVKGRQEVRDLALRELGPQDVRVQIAAAGVCHSDLSLGDGLLSQQFPVVLGHEGSGTVLAVGDAVTNVVVGDRVVLNWAPPCRACWYCEHSQPWLCENSTIASTSPYATLDGIDVYPGLGTAAFAAETVVASRAVIPVGDDVPLEVAALLGCAVLTGVGAVTNAASTKTGESALIIGLGGVGLSAVQGARLVGAEPIIAVDVSPDKEVLARACGATNFLLASDDLAKQVRHLTEGRGADVVIECVGRGATIRQAWSATRRGGRAVIVGVGRNDDKAEFGALEMFHFARSLIGCVYGSSDPEVEIPRLLTAWREGRIDLEALVTHRCGLDGIETASQRMRAGQGGRTLVIP